MKNELTYILGAGASYQSIPIVKNFANRFDDFASNLFIICQGLDPQSEMYELFEDAYLRVSKISEAFKTHQSFDTYFKKLFHTKEFEKISEGKKILNLYFIWEHLSKITNEPELKVETTFWKQSIIDKRYDALIAGLLKPLSGKSEPYCPVNFIT